MKVVGVVLGICVVVGAALALRLPVDAGLESDSASPGVWADVGDALLEGGNVGKARQAYARALQLGPGIPHIWVRDANFHFQLGEAGQGLRSASRAFRICDDYDDILFSYFDRLTPDPKTVLAEIGGDRRAARSYTEQLIATGNMDAAQTAWNQLAIKDTRLKVEYVDALLNARRYQAAQALGCGSLCNGSFENEPSGSALDWRIQASDEFETARDNSLAHSGKWSLRIRFLGTANVNYANVSQTVILSPGAHRLRAWVRAENLTTNEGPRLEVLNARTEPISGTHDWMPVELPFVVPAQTTAVQVRVIRTPSMKFDNKIGGALWLDSFSIQ
jgi:hypothetical protein